MTGYDHRVRRWRHLDTCQYKTIIEARVPRGRCETHGVRQIEVGWAEARSGFTALFEALVIDWLRETSQLAVARRLGLTWAEVHGIMERAVRRGLARRDREVIPYLGESLDGFYETLSEEQLAGIRGIAMDMWGPYIRSTLEHVPEAAHKIVFDKFHIVVHLKKAIDDVRKAEHRGLKAQGDETLKGTKYVWLKGKHRFDRGSWLDFSELRSSDLRTARAWAIVEMFSRFWSYVSVTWARKFFERWYAWAIRSRLEPIKKVARMIKTHLPNILTFLRHRITNAATEGINAKIQWIKTTGRGFTNRANFRTGTALALTVFGLTGCRTWQPVRADPSDFIRAERPGKVRVTTVNGERVELQGPRLEGDALLGEAASGAQDGRPPSAPLRLPLRDVHVLEARTVSLGRTLLLVAAGAPAAYYAGILAYLLIFCSGGCGS